MIWTLEPTAPWRVTAAQAPATAELADAAFLAAFPPPDRPFVEAALLDALRHGESSCACQLRGQPEGMLTLTRLLTASGAPHAVLARWAPETTGAGKAEAPARANALRQFLGSISHDLRTPLNGVLGMSRLLLDSGLRADQIEHARAIDTSAEQLLSAIEDLLEFATLDEETPLHPVDVDPRMLVDEVLASLAPRAAERELEVCALVAANVPEMVSVDPARVRQVLTYLIDDGISRTAVGDVVLRVAPDVTEAAEGREAVAADEREALDDGRAREPRLRFEIAIDETAWPGAPRNGVPAGALAAAQGAQGGQGAQSLGSRGVQGSRGSQGAQGSPGLDGSYRSHGSYGSHGSLAGIDAGEAGIVNGIGEESPAAAVCRHLVAAMGGTLDSVANADGTTTRRFTVRALPRPALPFAAPRYVSLAGRRVLCVDDQPVSRRVLLEQLRGWQLSVEASDEAHGALTLMKVAAAAGAPFELVIIDLRLPGVDGLALARLIRGEPALRAAKLVLLTAYPARGQAEVARQAGIDAYLEKPIREAPLRACLEALLSDEPADEHARSGEDRRPLQPRVLVADDHPLNQKVAVQLLRKLGCRVDVVSDGGDAVEAVQRTPYHLVLLDSRLPSSNRSAQGTLPGAGTGASGSAGTAAGARLGVGQGPSRRPPVIVLTGEDDEAARNTAREAGASDVIAKPLRLNVLREKLAQWIVATPQR